MINPPKQESFVMMTLDDYDKLTHEQADLKSRISQVSDNLMKFEFFLKALNQDDNTIQLFNKNLELHEKIGSALFSTYETVKENLTIDLQTKS